MPLTKEQAISADEFHHSEFTQGSKDRECYRVRRNGATQTWKTRPDKWRIPVKWGRNTYGQIHEFDARLWNVATNGACDRCRDDRPVIPYLKS